MGGRKAHHPAIPVRNPLVREWEAAGPESKCLARLQGRLFLSAVCHIGRVSSEGFWSTSDLLLSHHSPGVPVPLSTPGWPSVPAFLPHQRSGLTSLHATPQCSLGSGALSPGWLPLLRDVLSLCLLCPHLVSSSLPAAPRVSCEPSLESCSSGKPLSFWFPLTLGVVVRVQLSTWVRTGSYEFVRCLLSPTRWQDLGGWVLVLRFCCLLHFAKYLPN